MDRESKTGIILENRNMPALSLRAAIVPNSIDLENRTIRVEYTTGARVYRQKYFEDDYYEELSLEKGHVRLGRLNGGACPVLNSHSSYDLSDIIGTVLEGDERFATLKFSDRDEKMNGIWRDIVAGIIRSVSVGYMVYRYQDVTPDGDKVRILRAIDWEVFELSMVAVPADAGAGVRKLETNPCVVIGDLPETTLEGRNLMDPEAKKAGEEIQKPAPTNEAEIRAAATKAAEEATAAERVRGTEIRKLAAPHNLEADFVEGMVSEGRSVVEARALILDKLAARSEAAPINVRITGGNLDATQTRREAIENAIMHRADPRGVQLIDPAKEFRGLSLMDIAREIVGYKEARGMSKMEIVKRSMHSSSDFPIILANIANKTLRKAYADTKRSFIPWARQTTLPDFKQVQRVAFSNASSLKLVVEGGEYEAGTFSEGSEAYRLFTYGRTFVISREAIINDDMDAFTRVPGKMAAAAARLENRMVYDILLGNPLMADGVALFHATHGNLINNLLNVAGLGAMRSKMRVQKDSSSEDVLNLESEFIIVPSTLETTAAQLQGQFMPSNTGAINPYQNSFQYITEPYLDSISTTAWYGVANPNSVDTVEYAYLEGEVGPYIESREGFTVDGMEIKVRHDFAAKAIDFRGMAKSSGDGS